MFKPVLLILFLLLALILYSIFFASFILGYLLIIQIEVLTYRIYSNSSLTNEGFTISNKLL